MQGLCGAGQFWRRWPVRRFTGWTAKWRHALTRRRHALTRRRHALTRRRHAFTRWRNAFTRRFIRQRLAVAERRVVRWRR